MSIDSGFDNSQGKEAKIVELTSRLSKGSRRALLTDSVVDFSSKAFPESDHETHNRFNVLRSVDGKLVVLQYAYSVGLGHTEAPHPVLDINFFDPNERTYSHMTITQKGNYGSLQGFDDYPVGEEVPISLNESSVLVPYPVKGRLDKGSFYALEKKDPQLPAQTLEKVATLLGGEISVDQEARSRIIDIYGEEGFSSDTSAATIQNANHGLTEIDQGVKIMVRNVLAPRNKS